MRHSNVGIAGRPSMPDRTQRRIATTGHARRARAAFLDAAERLRSVVNVAVEHGG